MTLRLNRILLTLAIVAAAFIAFRPALKCSFVPLDDSSYVMENPAYGKGHAGLADSLSKPFNGHYHPITLLSFAIERGIAGDSPFPYHLDNLLLHCATAAVLFFLLLALETETVPAFIAALLFAVHPAQAETVAWISARKDLLCALFYFAALIAYVRYARFGARGYYYLCLGLFAAALLSKSMAVSLPFALVLVDWKIRRKIEWAEKLPHFMLAVMFAAIAVYADRADAAATGLNPVFSGLTKVQALGYSLFFYAKKLLWPSGLQCYYPSFDELNLHKTMFFRLSPLLAIAAALAVYRKARPCLFGLLFFALAILPVATRALPADRYLYIPSAGFILAAVTAVYMLAARWIHIKTVRVAAVSGAASVAAIFMVLASIQTKTWQDGVSLWTRSNAAAPGRAKPMYLLALAYQENKNMPLAIAQFDRTLDMAPHFPAAREARADALASCGLYEKALADYTILLDENPSSVALFEKRASAFSRNKDHAAAVRDLDKAIALSPDEARLYQERGVVRHRAGQYREAEQDFRTAVRIEPSAPFYHFSLGTFLASTGRLRAAEREFLLATGINPEYGEAFNNLAALSLAQNRLADAKRYAGKAVSCGYKISPDMARELEEKSRRASRPGTGDLR